MGIFIFTDEYKLNYRNVDEEHQECFRIMNEIYDLNRARKSSRQIVPILDYLIEFLAGHFRNEEELMREMKYPDVDLHTKSHEVMLKRYSLILAEVSKPNAILPLDTMAFFTKCLSQHILKVDRKYIQFEQERLKKDDTSSAE